MWRDYELCYICLDYGVQREEKIEHRKLSSTVSSDGTLEKVDGSRSAAGAAHYYQLRRDVAYGS